MILIVEDQLWQEFSQAASALANMPIEKRSHSNYSESMEKTHAISRVIEAKRKLVLALRICQTSDRQVLLAEVDKLRARPSVQGPKPRIKDPLTER